MADGTGRATEGDQHPDPIVEALRWQRCEGELMQALGRVRAINRTAEDPVQIDILTNVALPLTVDEIVSWRAATDGDGGWIETWARHGVVIHDSPADAARFFPDTWANLRAAERDPRPSELDRQNPI